MTTPEQKYYDGMNTVLAPVRAGKSFMQTLLIIGGVIFVGLGLPFYCLFSGTHMTTGTWEFTGLTVMFLFCFFMAPWYTVLGGIIGAVGYLAYIASKYDSYDDTPALLRIPVVLCVFFSIGIAQRLIRAALRPHPAPPQSPKPGRWEEFVERGRNPLPRNRNKEGKAGSAEQEKAAPTFDGFEGVGSDSTLKAAQNCNCKACHEAFEVLGIEAGANQETVKATYRDLAKVWHPDRFADGETRLKKKAEEQLKSINAAYAHIEKHFVSQLSDNAGNPDRLVPLNEALREAVDHFAGASREMREMCEKAEGRGFRNTEEAAQAVRHFLSLQREICSRLTIVISRIHDEMPGVSTADLEAKLAAITSQSMNIANIS